jgi:hypothetical protein
VGISRDYPLKTQTSKQPTGEISGYELIPPIPLNTLKVNKALGGKREIRKEDEDNRRTHLVSEIIYIPSRDFSLGLPNSFRFNLDRVYC